MGRSFVLQKKQKHPMGPGKGLLDRFEVNRSNPTWRTYFIPEWNLGDLKAQELHK